MRGFWIWATIGEICGTLLRGLLCLLTRPILLVLVFVLGIALGVFVATLIAAALSRSAV
jgi:hypothetical protein